MEASFFDFRMCVVQYTYLRISERKKKNSFVINTHREERMQILETGKEANRDKGLFFVVKLIKPL